MLNLGCGSVYKPNYINIDKYNNIVADKMSDIDDLPFESNSVDLIEASQVIEHFDYIHCKYVLSEWFRVLQSTGTLILETPDLKKSFKKLLSKEGETRKRTLQWVYGIDSPGLLHKTGFTFNILRDLLEEIGFENITKERQKTHEYEYGLRISCIKPEKYLEKQLIACFRKQLKARLHINDSYFLIPLENWLKQIIYTHHRIKFQKENHINKIISRTLLCNPLIPLAYLEECLNFSYITKSEMEEKANFLNFLVENNLHQKVFSLWIRSKKEIGKLQENFLTFLDRIELLMLDILKDPSDLEERLKYILELEPREIELFDFYLILMEAKKLFNQGVKHFHNNEYTKAMNCLLKSSQINPDQARAYWNIARLHIKLHSEKVKVLENYEIALKLRVYKQDQKSILREILMIRENKTNLIEGNPVVEEY